LSEIPGNRTKIVMHLEGAATTWFHFSPSVDSKL
jgi:hypothetical protein